MSVINNSPLMLGEDGYQLSRSVRLRSSASAYFNRTPASAGNRKTWTWSGWVKRGGLGATQVMFSSQTNGSNTMGFLFLSNDTLLSDCYVGGAAQFSLQSTQVFRDVSAWYHLMLVVDTTQATASNRIKFYVNGSQVTAFSTANYPSQNLDLFINQASVAHGIGRSIATAVEYLDGYLTEINFIDGQALTPASFGETDAITGVWKPKKYAGTYGTNGFYLNFSDNSAATAAAIGKDYSGNGNNWTPNNISVTAGSTYDSMLDVPTMWADGGNGRGNYAVLNPLSTYGSNTFSSANLNVTVTSGTSNVAIGSVPVSSGKWYWEVTFTSGANGEIGVSDASAAISSSSWVSANGWTYYSGTGKKANSGVETTYGATYTTNDVVGVALDVDAGTLEFYKNGTSQGVAFNTGLTGKTLVPMVGNGASASSQAYAVNFGQRPFSYTPPTGFKALNTLNLPDSAVKKGNKHFDVSLWTGDGGSTKTISGLGFQPGFVWSKQRNIAQSHDLRNAVTGGGASLASDATAAEYTGTTYGVIQSFNTDGFTATKGSDPTYSFFNANGGTYAAWQWKESVTAGFDIVTYSGTGAAQTVSHSLGVAPRMIIAKRRNGAQNWFVGHGSLASWSSALEGLNTTAAVNNGATAVWNATAPTSSVFSVGTDLSASGGTYVAYLFAEVPGFSKFGSYTGNGSADGPFVFTGFRPKFVLIKRTDAIQSWNITDTARKDYNYNDLRLLANDSGAEEVRGSTDNIDMLSNGFKIRSTATILNASGGTYIFAAFAESPFKNSLAR